MSTETPIEIRCANTIKGLAMDAVQAANSGHPGAPMGMSDIATALWATALKHDPSDPAWADRDRVILSNGHASMLLYSMLYLTDTALTLDDLKQFRQWGSKTAGHPEYGEAPGIETTTGPLGQGFANGVGMALSEAWLSAKFGTELVDHHTFVLTGDGCLMEGVSSEAASLAGHLGLGKLVVLFDDNSITIDGSTDLSCSEDTGARFAAYGWQVLACDGHDQAAILAAIAEAKGDAKRPTFIRCRTQIGKGSPNLEGSNKTHGAPLGAAEIAASKEALGMDPEVDFAVPEDVLAHFRGGNGQRKAVREAWEARLAAHPERAQWGRFQAAPNLSEVAWPDFAAGEKLATRKASHQVLNAIAAQVENVVGGSADLAGSNGSTINGGGDVQGGAHGHRNVNFGIREHAMASICNGMALHGGVVPYCATFLVFHDYMRPAVRLAALMGQPVIYIYTHDSVFLGEDGPTHQPVEHLMAMRTIPNLDVIRPGDAAETAEAWKAALTRRDGPTALCLTRQGLEILDRNVMGDAKGLHQGAYVVSEAQGEAQVAIVATGSEVNLAIEAQRALQAEGVAVRVVSMPSWLRFEGQDAEVQDSILPPRLPTVSVEAGITFGWSRWADYSVGIDRFGASAPGSVVADKLGINVANVVRTVREAAGLVD